MSLLGNENLFHSFQFTKLLSLSYFSFMGKQVSTLKSFVDDSRKDVGVSFIPSLPIGLPSQCHWFYQLINFLSGHESPTSDQTNS